MLVGILLTIAIVGVAIWVALGDRSVPVTNDQQNVMNKFKNMTEEEASKDPSGSLGPNSVDKKVFDAPKGIATDDTNVKQSRKSTKSKKE